MKFRFVIILFSILLILSACQTIKKKTDEVAEKKMKSITGGMMPNIPGL